MDLNSNLVVVIFFTLLFLCDWTLMEHTSDWKHRELASTSLEQLGHHKSRKLYSSA